MTIYREKRLSYESGYGTMLNNYELKENTLCSDTTELFSVISKSKNIIFLAIIFSTLSERKYD